jgi:hypothetical protein
MIEEADPRSPRARITDALRALDDAFGPPGSRPFPADNDRQLTALASGLREALTALAASVGECQVDVPYAAIQLVRHPDGSREWCCAHPTPHCDPV